MRMAVSPLYGILVYVSLLFMPAAVSYRCRLVQGDCSVFCIDESKNAAKVDPEEHYGGNHSVITRIY
jgi:hypothetical protein